MKTLRLTMIAFFFSGIACSQDQLVKMDGKEISCRVTSIEPNTISYTLGDSSGKEAFIIPRSEIFMVRFENGTKEIMYKETPVRQVDYFSLGKADAQKYYLGKGALAGGMFLPFVPYVGEIGLIYLMTSKPKQLSNPNNPNNNLIYTNNQYKEGFQAGARPKRNSKVLGGFGIAMGAVVVAAIAIVSQDNARGY